jgi:20S proteasome subunit alpha 6
MRVDDSWQRSTGELASYQQKMFRIDDHVGIAIAGLTSDARVLRYDNLSFVQLACWILNDASNFMRQQALSERMVFNRPMPVNRLVSAIADSEFAWCHVRYSRHLLHG